MLNKQNLMYPMFGVCVFLANANSVQITYGNTNIHDMTISNEMKIVGVGNIKDAVLDKDVQVLGCLRSKSSHYLANIYAVGSDLNLSDDQVDGDVHVTNYLKSPTLYLNHTCIKGQVIFHGKGKGKVIKDSKSIIEKGIQNGEVE